MHLAARAQDEIHGTRGRQKRAHADAVAALVDVRSEHGKRIPVLP
jgi:hypothetical protein